MHLSPQTFSELRRLIQGLCGLALADDKTYLVRHRLEPLVRGRRLAGFDELCAALKRGGDQALEEQVIAAITTQETSFFRDGHPFEALRGQILPECLARRAAAAGPPRPVRLWSAGTATGQEAYSLAMIVAELGGGRESGGPAFEIVATDISAAALEAAAAGEYPPRDTARGLAASQLARFFEPCPVGFRVRGPLRRLVAFRRLNLLEPFESLGMFEVILCRNVLIYFDEPTRRDVVRRLEARLAPGGWLMLGAAENLYGVSEALESQRVGETLVYRRAIEGSRQSSPS
jgi:chemotaxis protein methyltransferase CheR